MKLIKNNERNSMDTGIDGVALSPFWENDSNGGVALVTMEKHAFFPMHNHPGWEQLYVLGGKLTIAGQILTTGDYLFTEPGEVHAVEANENSELLVFSEKGIEVFGEREL